MPNLDNATVGAGDALGDIVDTQPGMLPEVGDIGDELMLAAGGEANVAYVDDTIVEQPTVTLSVTDGMFVALAPNNILTSSVAFNVEAVNPEVVPMPAALRDMVLGYAQAAGKAVANAPLHLSQDVYSRLGLPHFYLKALSKSLDHLSAEVTVLPQHVQEVIETLTARYLAAIETARTGIINTLAAKANVAVEVAAEYLDSIISVDVHVQDEGEVKVDAGEALALDLTVMCKNIAIEVTVKQALFTEVGQRDDYAETQRYVIARLNDAAALVNLLGDIDADPAVIFHMNAELAMADALDFSVQPSVQSVLAECLSADTVEAIDNPFAGFSYQTARAGGYAIRVGMAR